MMGQMSSPVRTSVRTGFGLPRPILGAPLVLVRTAWVLVPVCLLAVVVETVSVYLTRNIPTMWTYDRINRIAELLAGRQPGAALHLVRPNLYAWIIRVVTDEVVQLVGASLVVVTAAQWVAGQRAGSSTVWVMLVRKAGRLVMIWFLSRGLVAVLMVAGLFAILASSDVPELLMTGLSMIMVTGGCGLIAALLLYAAIPIVVVESTGVIHAIGRSAVLATRRLPAVIGTILLAKLASWLVGVVLGGGAHLVAAGIETSWPVVGAEHGIATAVSVAVTSVLYLLRYLDTRARREGYDRARMVAEMDVLAPRGAAAPA